SQGKGFEVAGSAAWTDLNYATKAFVAQGADITLGGDSTMIARDRLATVAFAGDGVWGGSVGFGTSWAWNHVDRRVHATITDSTITQSAGTLSLDSVIWDIAKDNGRTLLPSAYAVAVTLGLGSDDTSVELTGTVAVNQFNTDTSENAVEASMSGTTYQQPDGGAGGVTGLSLSATDNTNLLALAGAVDADADLTIGVAVAENELENAATASIEQSSIDVNKGNIEVLALINPELNAFALGVSVTDNEGAALAGSGASNIAPLSADAHVKGLVDTVGKTDTSITGAGDITIQAEIA
ncbi:MAG: hypothetical protein GY720_11660, partial [bacterium]|nr:hypothetical protein [bacterium]